MRDGHRIRVDPKQDPLQQAIEAQCLKSSPQADHALQTGHVGVERLTLAKQELVGRHLANGSKCLVARRTTTSTMIDECPIDFLNRHTS